MARLVLKFESEVLKEVPLGTRPVTIGRAPDNDLAIDNLAVSNYHARVYAEAGQLVIEDLNSLNGTFVNDIRVERGTLHDGDKIQAGKHHIQVDTSHDAALPVDGWRKAAAPKVNDTMVLDTRERREMLEQAGAAGERSQLSPTRLRVPTLSVQRGRTDRHGSRTSSNILTDRDWALGDGHGAFTRLVRAERRRANSQARRRLLPWIRRPYPQSEWSTHQRRHALARRRRHRR